MKSKIVILLILFVTYSCGSFEPDPELTMKRTPYSGNKIRFDGFYFSKGPDYTSYRFFYSNGVVFIYSGMDNKIVENIDILKRMEFVRNSKVHWKVFQIYNDTLYSQGWTSADDGFFRPIQEHFISDGYFKILNDSTFKFLGTSNYKTDNGVYYHFKKCFPKPDSTNIFIK